MMALSVAVCVAACGEQDRVPDTCAGVPLSKTNNPEYPWALIEFVRAYAPRGEEVEIPLIEVRNIGDRRLCIDRLEARAEDGPWVPVTDVELPLVVADGGDPSLIRFRVSATEVGIDGFEVRLRVNDPRDVRPHVFVEYETFAPPRVEGDPCWPNDADCPAGTECWRERDYPWGSCVAERFE